MQSIYRVIVSAFFILAMQSCSKKTHPSPAVVHTEIKSDTTLVKSDTSLVKSDTALKKTDSLTAIKPVIKRKPIESIPKVIAVNDKYANKSVDGRYYYDLQGHRYWRSNKDGKYYLFNKSMLTDDAFKKPDKK
ncbi:MAG: hypothetical protein ABI707_00045 [Ferruginibacter sp.]